MICPDCQEEMSKAAIEAEDLSGWFVGYLCGCSVYDKNIEIFVHAANGLADGEIVFKDLNENK